VQRPEAHAVHHERGRHAGNDSDLAALVGNAVRDSFDPLALALRTESWHDGRMDGKVWSMWCLVLAGCGSPADESDPTTDSGATSIDDSGSTSATESGSSAGDESSTGGSSVCDPPPTDFAITCILDGVPIDFSVGVTGNLVDESCAVENVVEVADGWTLELACETANGPAMRSLEMHGSSLPSPTALAGRDVRLDLDYDGWEGGGAFLRLRATTGELLLARTIGESIQVFADNGVSTFDDWYAPLVVTVHNAPLCDAEPEQVGSCSESRIALDFALEGEPTTLFDGTQGTSGTDYAIIVDDATHRLGCTRCFCFPSYAFVIVALQ